jgi:hypothetical protein
MSVVKTNHHDVKCGEMWCHHVFRLEGRGLVLNPLYLDEVLVIQTSLTLTEDDLEKLVWEQFWRDCDLGCELTPLDQLLAEGDLSHISRKYNAKLSVVDSPEGGLNEQRVREMLQ